MNNLLTRNGFVNTKVRAITSGPAVNFYINLAGRHPGGTVSREEYLELQAQIIAMLESATDTNATFTLGAPSVRLFDKIYPRPVTKDLSSPEFGYETSDFIGRDSGDIFAILTPGYNFDGTQNPVVIRQGDTADANQVLSQPNFYGAHGYDPALPNMSAILLAAGPNIGRGELTLAHNIDLAPTIAKLAGIDGADTIEGSPLLMASLGLNVRGTLPNGVSAGDVTADSVVLWAHSIALGNVTFEVSTSPLHIPALFTMSAAVTDINQPVKVKVEGLQPFTAYFFSVQNAAGAMLTGRFRTAARALDGRKGLRFGVSGDSRGELAPYPSIANAPARNLNFFVKLGDTIYADVASPNVNIPQARTLAEYRAKNAEVYGDRLGANTLADLQSSTPIFSMIDDHEVINDFAGGAAIGSDPRFDQTGTLINDTQLYRNGLQAFTEYNAIEDLRYNTPGNALTHNKPNLYRSRVFGGDAAIFMLDARSYRDAELPPAASLSPADVGAFLARSFDINPTTGQPLPLRTMLSAPQLAQLKSDLLAAQAAGVTWKFVCVPEPIQNLGVLAASDRFEGYAAERTALLHFIRANGIRNVVFIAADIHGTLVNNLTYQVGPGQPQIATDMFEITTGAIAYDEPFGPTVLDLAANIVVAPNVTLLQQFLGTLGLPNRQAFDTLLTREQKDAALASLLNAQVAQLGYDTLGLQGSPIPAQLEVGAYSATFTYGWTEFDIDAETQRLVVTTYGIAPYSQAQVTGEILGRAPEVVQRFTVMPSAPVMSPHLLARLAAGRLQLSWPAAALHYILQGTPALGADAQWTDVNALPELVGDRVRVHQDLTGVKFFRLLRRD